MPVEELSWLSLGSSAFFSSSPSFSILQLETKTNHRRNARTRQACKRVMKKYWREKKNERRRRRKESKAKSCFTCTRKHLFFLWHAFFLSLLHHFFLLYSSIKQKEGEEEDEDIFCLNKKSVRRGSISTLLVSNINWLLKQRRRKKNCSCIFVLSSRSNSTCNLNI